MLSPEWRNWKLADWNRALVQEVFFNSASSDIPITRINASDRSLVNCIGIDSDDEEVREHFITCFGNNSRSVREKFKMYYEYEFQTKKEDIPAVFAHLFLTLLAGSADANSIGFGQFRERFSELFKSFNVGLLTFEDLPKFWNLVSNWSVDRNNRLGDCRVLHLTYRGREKLIGNSKKLAFPTYSDERLLTSILDPDNLDFGQVERAILNKYNKFTEQFQEEFNNFYTYFHKSDLERAFHTPLWGVVLDLSLESQKKLVSNYGSYSVEVFIQSQFDPMFYLNTDINGCKLLGDSYLLNEKFNSKDKNFLIDIPESESLISVLNDMVARYPELNKLKLWKQLKNGFISFFPDEGYLTTKGIFSDNDRCCFLVKNTIFEELNHSRITFFKKPILIKFSGSSSDWRMLYFEKIQYSEVQLFLPERLRRVIGLSWRPPQISLRDGVKYGQSYMINPCSNPRFDASKFSTGSYEISFYNNKVPIVGLLEKNDDFMRIPPSDISRELDDISKIKYEAILLDSSGKANKVITAFNKSPKPYKFDFNYSDKWFLSGRSGELITYCELFNFQKKISQEGKKHIEKIKPLFKKSKDLRSSQVTGLVKLSSSLTPNYLRWISESLSLRFQTRSNILYSELITYTKDIANIVGVKHSRLRNLLFLSGWLIGLQDRMYQGFSPHLSPRTISIIKENNFYQCRLVGIFNEAEEHKILQVLDFDENFYRLSDPSSQLSIGAIEINLKTIDKANQIIDQFYLLRLDQNSFGHPLSPDGISLYNAPLDRLPYSIGLTVLRNGEWVDYENDKPLSKFMIIRHKESSKYWVFNGKKFIQTDNELAIRFIHCALNEITLGKIYKNGECVFDSRIFSLPDSLSRWWMHWGGGCISYSERGEIIFSGSVDESVWFNLRSWIGDFGIQFTVKDFNFRLSRRQFALNMKVDINNKRKKNAY